MWSKIKKWWNREWSNWEEDSIVSISVDGNDKGEVLILKRTSNDGLVEYKQIVKFQL